MKRIWRSVVGFFGVFVILGTGCASKKLLSKEQLKEIYPAISGSSRLENMDTVYGPLVSLMKSSDPVCIVSPLSEPQETTVQETEPTGSSNAGARYEALYKTMKCRVVKVLHGGYKQNTIQIASTKNFADFMDNMKVGSKYLLCLIKLDSQDLYYAGSEGTFYLADTNQIVPFLDWSGETELVGLTVDEFMEKFRSWK